LAGGCPRHADDVRRGGLCIGAGIAFHDRARASAASCAQQFSHQWPGHCARPGRASGNHRRRGFGERPQDLSSKPAGRRLAVLEQVERGQRLRGELVVARKGPVAFDSAQQHRQGGGFAGCIGDYGHFVDQDLQRITPQVGVQRPRLTAAQGVRAIRPGHT